MELQVQRTLEFLGWWADSGVVCFAAAPRRSTGDFSSASTGFFFGHTQPSTFLPLMVLSHDALSHENLVSGAAVLAAAAVLAEVDER